MSLGRTIVERRFRRSIRVDVDHDDASSGFIWTPSSQRAIAVMADHLSELQHGAFTWTGTYGCGKSSLAAVLAELVRADRERRGELLARMPAEVAADLDRAFWGREPEWRVLPIVGRRQDVEKLVGAELHAAGGAPGGDAVTRLAAMAHDRGVLLIVDEMGKLLEEAAGGEGDAHFFQELAEAANRSNGRLVVIGILHQAFDDYSAKLSRDVRDEWLKVQGRFVDIQLAPTGLEQIALLSKAIVSQDAPDTSEGAGIVARALLGERAGAGRLASELASCSPLNPVTAALLGPLSKRRFGQNQRSIFGFLGSAEPFGFQEFLLGPSRDLYEPSLLWSYLRTNLEPSIMVSPDGHRWSLAVEAVERCESRAADELVLRVVKTVALVDMLRDRSGIVASLELIGAAIPDAAPEELTAALDLLAGWSLIVHRRHVGGYSLFAGSDFDIEAAIEDARRQMGGCDFSRLHGSDVTAPILAKRHYHETGAMRWFDVRIVSLDDATSHTPVQKRGATGTFLLVVNDQGLSKATLRSRMSRIAERLREVPVAIGVTGQSYVLRETTLELAALERLQSTSPELKGDAVARREVASRIARLVSDLEERIRDALAGAAWSIPMLPDVVLPQGVTGSSRLAVLASTFADHVYPSAPKLLNELLNRTRPSSNAVGALRALMTAMVRSPSVDRLGIEGYPPEMGLYISLLERTGLHDPDAPGCFSPPAEGDPAGLREAWGAADALLSASAVEGLTLDELQRVWSSSPFGIKDGLLPLLSLAYILSRLGRVSLYLDGLFCSSVNDLLVDRMMQEASSVRMRLSVASAAQEEMLLSMAALLTEIDGQSSTIPAEPLALARRLVGFVLELPGWVRRTARLDVDAKAVRDLASSAHDPNKFLLDDLPSALADRPGGAVHGLRSGLRQLAVAYGDLLSQLTEAMLDELRVGRGRDELNRLRERARNIAGVSGNFRLDAFASRLATFDGTQGAVEGILSLAANKPPRDWTDRDVDGAMIEMASLARDFMRTEGLVHVHGRRNSRTSIALYISDPARPSLMKSELSLGSAELDRVRQVADRLRAAMDSKLTPEIALAAVAELAARLMEERSPAAEPLAVGDAA